MNLDAEGADDERGLSQTYGDVPLALPHSPVACVDRGLLALA